MATKLTKIQRKADALIREQVENYRGASKSHREARRQSAFDKTKLPGETRPPSRFAMPENAANAFKMNMDRASGALDALHNLFPDVPAWTETKWIH